MELNRDNIRKIRGLIVFTVGAVVVGINYQKILVLAGDCVSMISPFLLGGAIAFVLNVPMRAIETHTPLKKMKKFRRPMCLVLSVAAVAGVLLLVIFVVGPELVNTLIGLQKSIPVFFENIQKQAEDVFARNPGIVMYIEEIEVNWEQVGKDIVGFLSSGAGSMVASTVSAAMSIVSGVANFCIGFVFAVYVLLQKETLARQIKKLLRAYLPKGLCQKMVRVATLTEKTFSNFLAGQCVEAVILGTMFFVTLTVMRLPYALLIGVLIAFTALIPIFGAFVGCGVGAFLILMVSPVQALVFMVVFQILQQIEGNLIYPHVVGGSVGLPSIWVLVAVTVGGSAMGVLGMLVFIPLCSVLYTLLREAVGARLEGSVSWEERAVEEEPASWEERAVEEESASWEESASEVKPASDESRLPHSEAGEPTSDSRVGESRESAHHSRSAGHTGAQPSGGQSRPVPRGSKTRRRRR